MCIPARMLRDGIWSLMRDAYHSHNGTKILSGLQGELKVRRMDLHGCSFSRRPAHEHEGYASGDHISCRDKNSELKTNLCYSEQQRQANDK